MKTVTDADFESAEPVQRVHGLKPKGALRAALEPWIP